MIESGISQICNYRSIYRSMDQICLQNHYDLLFICLYKMTLTMTIIIIILKLPSLLPMIMIMLLLPLVLLLPTVQDIVSTRLATTSMHVYNISVPIFATHQGSYHIAYFQVEVGGSGAGGGGMEVCGGGVRGCGVGGGDGCVCVCEMLSWSTKIWWSINILNKGIGKHDLRCVYCDLLLDNFIDRWHTEYIQACCHFRYM